MTLTNVFFVGSLLATAATAALLYFEWPRGSESRVSERTLSMRVGAGNLVLRRTF